MTEMRLKKNRENNLNARPVLIFFMGLLFTAITVYLLFAAINWHISIAYKVVEGKAANAQSLTDELDNFGIANNYGLPLCANQIQFRMQPNLARFRFSFRISEVEFKEWYKTLKGFSSFSIEDETDVLIGIGGDLKETTINNGLVGKNANKNVVVVYDRVNSTCFFWSDGR